jgi:hypothetical protein
MHAMFSPTTPKAIVWEGLLDTALARLCGFMPYAEIGKVGTLIMALTEPPAQKLDNCHDDHRFPQIRGAATASKSDYFEALFGQ